MMPERSDTPGEGPSVNDDARPDGAAAADTPAPAAPAPASLDPDEAELTAARAAARAESTGEAPSGQEPAAASPPATPAATEAPPARPQQPVMVPKQRFDEVLARARKAEEQALMLAGAVQVLSRPGQGQTAPQGDGGAGQPQPAAAPAPASPQQRIEALEAEILAAAEKFDAGEITLAEFKRQESTRNQQILAAREEALLARVPTPAAPQPGIADQAIQVEHLNRLYQAHPYARNLTEQQAQALAQRASLDLAMEGNPIGTGPAETMRLQARVAALSDEWGPKWGVAPTKAPAASPSQAPQPPARTGGAPALSPQAQARANKLALAASLPPDTASLGAGAAGDDAISEQRIETMTDDEILALPPSIRARFLS